MWRDIEGFIKTHLEKHAVLSSVNQHMILACPDCSEQVSPRAVQLRQKRGYDHVRCQVCESIIHFAAKASAEDVAREKSKLEKMHASADTARDKAVVDTILDGKRHAGKFDVFVSYNTRDQSDAIKISESLLELGILPWIDKWNVKPGDSWHTELESVIDNVKSALVLIGPSQYTEEQKRELDQLDANIRSAKKRQEKPPICARKSDSTNEARQPRIGTLAKTGSRLYSEVIRRR